jgi:hypothetical protein
MFRKFSGTCNWLYLCLAVYVRIYKAVPLKFKLPAHCNLTGSSVTVPPPVIAQQYSSAIALSFSHGRIRRTFKNVIISIVTNVVIISGPLSVSSSSVRHSNIMLTEEPSAGCTSETSYEVTPLFGALGITVPHPRPPPKVRGWQDCEPTGLMSA